MVSFMDLLATPDTCARKTLSSVLVESKKAYDAKAAEELMDTYPGFDLLGILPYVTAGIESLSQDLGVDPELLIDETDLSSLENANTLHVLHAVEAIHNIWIVLNLNARNWVAKFFSGRLNFYLPAAYQPFDVIKMNVLFIEKYLYKGDNFVNYHEFEELFINSKDSKVLDAAKANLIDCVYSMQDQIANELINFKIMTKDPSLSERIMLFVRETNMTPQGIVSRMITESIKVL